MSTVLNETGVNGENGSSSEKEETYLTHRLQGSSIWKRKEDYDDGSQYFMSEPSISEEGSDLGLRSPRGTGSPDPLLHQHNTEVEQSHLNIPAPPLRPQTPPSPSSPGGNTSLSSRESPFWPSKKFHFMAYPPGESDQSWAGSTDGQQLPSRALKVDSTFGGPRMTTTKSPQPQSADNDGNKSPTTDHIRHNGVASKSLHSNSSSTSDDGRQRADVFLKQLKFQSLGALKIASPGAYVSDRTLNEADDEEEAGEVVRPRETIVGVNGDNKDAKDAPLNHRPQDGTTPDETLHLTLSDSFDDGKQESADVEKTLERPRRTKISSKPAPIHRRTRSGDDVAAMIMTGGTEWRGIEGGILPAPPLFQGNYEDEESLDHTAGSSGQGDLKSSRNGRGPTPAERAMHASAGFAMGTAGKQNRYSRRARSQRHGLGQQDLWSLSDSTRSTGFGFDGDQNSTLSFPSFVERPSTGSVSTLEMIGAESKLRSHSQSEVDNLQKTTVEKEVESGPSGDGVPRGRSASCGSAATFETSSVDSRASSKFSWISHSFISSAGDSHAKGVRNVSVPTRETSQNGKG